MKIAFILILLLTIAHFDKAQAYDFPYDVTYELQGYKKIVKCSEVYPEPDLRPYRFNASIFKSLSDNRMQAVIHRVNNANNHGIDYRQDYVLSQVVSQNPKTTTYWNETQTIILNDVQPYQTNKSILSIKGESGSRWMKCFDI